VTHLWQKPGRKRETQKMRKRKRKVRKERQSEKTQKRGRGRGVQQEILQVQCRESMVQESRKRRTQQSSERWCERVMCRQVKRDQSAGPRT